MGEELREASAVILVVASRYVRDMARQIASLIQPDAVVCIAAKGLEQGSAKTLSDPSKSCRRFFQIRCAHIVWHILFYGDSARLPVGFALL